MNSPEMSHTEEVNIKDIILFFILLLEILILIQNNQTPAVRRAITKMRYFWHL